MYESTSSSLFLLVSDVSSLFSISHHNWGQIISHWRFWLTWLLMMLSMSSHICQQFVCFQRNVWSAHFPIWARGFIFLLLGCVNASDSLELAHISSCSVGCLFAAFFPLGIFPFFSISLLNVCQFCLVLKNLILCFIQFLFFIWAFSVFSFLNFLSVIYYFLL